MMSEEDRKTRMRVGLIAAACALAAGLLAGPAATWLQGREFRPPADAVPDAVYLVAGQRAQDSRVEAVADYANALRARRPAAAVSILIGNDSMRRHWRRDEQRNLSIAEWAARRVCNRLQPAARFQCRIVPGEFWGTDAEMAALAEDLSRRPEVRSVALVTSAFHARRAVTRLKERAAAGLEIHALAAKGEWRDRAPWVVASELFKLARDGAGLSAAPLITREFYVRAARPVAPVAWACLALLTYVWLLYPPLLALLSRRAPAPAPEAGEPDVFVEVLIAAHNEESCIEERIRNLLELDFPVGRLRIHVGVDGATDRTASLARALGEQHPNVRIHDFPERRGKAAVLKRLAAEGGVQGSGLRVQRSEAGDRKSDAGRPALGGGERILVFTDANTRFRPDALAKLLRHFADPRVGGVCGRLVLKQQGETGNRKPETGNSKPAGQEERISTSDIRHSTFNIQHLLRTPEGLYWGLENWLKKRESRLDSCLGANGAIYAVREELFWADLPDNTVVEDFVIGMKVREQGRRLAYDPEAVAEEEAPAWQHEWRRRARIGAGDFQALWLCRRCLLPRFGLFAWMFGSHKVLRWFTPHLLLLAIGASWLRLATTFEAPASWAGLAAHGAYQAVVAGAPAILAGAAVGRLLALAGRRPPQLLSLCDHAVTMQAALLAGFLRFCCGGLRGYWERTPRHDARG
ncbi:MAG: glycosyltransferase [Verrucomicrobiota bacterium]|nr:glycosyltransferase [Verrucomicrobiota bacterium]